LKFIEVAGDSELLRYLIEHVPSLDRKTLKQFLKFGAISVNGAVTTRFDYSLKAGDRIEIETEKRKVRLRSVKSKLPILHEDDALLVVKKPAGLLTIATEKEKQRTAYYLMTDYVRSSSPTGEGRIFIVHRLDQDVSGLLVLAKTEAAKEALQNGWEDAEKRYFAVVEGIPERPEDTIESFLREDKFRRVYSGNEAPGAKHSVTRYRVLKTTQENALLEVDLITGRKNQIRVHLSDIGHPIIGDAKYGARTDPAGRIGLHACHLAFRHPSTRQWMTFEDPLPAPLAEVMGDFSQGRPRDP
jgi:23S rRNA pseudouridine1911/1915/1917 synthase